MAIDYQKTAKDLVKELGGDGNISNVTHCATRLRFILKDESIVDKGCKNQRCNYYCSGRRSVSGSNRKSCNRCVQICYGISYSG